VLVASNLGYRWRTFSFQAITFPPLVDRKVEYQFCCSHNLLKYPHDFWSSGSLLILFAVVWLGCAFSPFCIIQPPKISVRADWNELPPIQSFIEYQASNADWNSLACLIQSSHNVFDFIINLLQQSNIYHRMFVVFSTSEVGPELLPALFISFHILLCCSSDMIRLGWHTQTMSVFRCINIGWFADSSPFKFSASWHLRKWKSSGS